MRYGHIEIALRPRSSAATSFPVSAYTRRRSGSPKSGRFEPVNPPTNPLSPAMPTSLPAISSTDVPRGGDPDRLSSGPFPPARSGSVPPARHGGYLPVGGGFPNPMRGYETGMAGDDSFERIGATMKRAAAALRGAEVDFALAGSL